MVYGGRAARHADAADRFNLSHSGDTIALLLSDEGEVGDIDDPPARRWRSSGDRYSLGEHAEMEARNVRATAWRRFWRIGRVKPS